MNKKFKYYVFLSAAIICASTMTGCLNHSHKGDPITIVFNPDSTFQTIQNFGASDCWSGQFIGNWPTEQKNKIADLLFSKEQDNVGNPLGIGLTCWRFNIGAGSAEQGESSNIEDEWRRSPGFMQTDGTMNIHAQQAQRWILKAAHERGCNQFVAFVNSPPVQLTKNGKAYADDSLSGNLLPGNYENYARFLTTVLLNIKSTDGIEMDYISPFNEPEWNWMAGKNGKAGQEGSPWYNHEIKEITTYIDAALNANQLKTKIEIPESGRLNFLYENANSGRSNHIEDFFSPESPNYVGGLASIAPKIAGHSYFTTWDNDQMISIRRKVNEKLNQVNPNLQFWMSEYCILEDNETISGPGKDLGMKPALYMARVIHNDLTVANANAWQWWLAVSPYDYKDGLLYIDKNKSGGNIVPSKMLWTFGNFSRFITPGSKRIQLCRSDLDKNERNKDLLISAYQQPTGQYVCVFINLSENAQTVLAKANHTKFKKISGFITSENAEHNLSFFNAGKPEDPCEIPGKSIVTLVFE